ncbi:MAG: tRNA (adenosine(37)-N6)-threonylcarbamoyltransferase complex ATPase subunit type 1 TsaE [Pseudomonadota bacterium]
MVYFSKTSTTPDQTILIGKKLGSILQSGDVVTLSGELGAGKTWLTKGIALGLDIADKDTVISPSFTIINEYQGRLTIFHMDFYRLAAGDDADLGLEEYLYGSGVTIIEWPERMAEILPDDRMAVTLLVEDDKRQIIFEPKGNKWVERLEKLFNNL